MSLNISIKSDLRKLQKQLNTLERDAYPKAVVRTLNRVASSAKTASTKHIAPVRRGSSANAVYTRKTKHSLPVKQLYGPGIAQLFKKKENINIMKLVVSNRLPVEFKNNLQYYASRIRA